MTSEEIRVANILEKLEKLKGLSLKLNDNVVVYQLCELLQELVPDIVLKE